MQDNSYSCMITLYYPNITLLGKLSLRSKSTVSMSRYRQQLKYKYKSLSLSSPEEVLECRSSEYINLFLTKFDKKSKTKKENLVSGYLNSILKNQSQLPQDTERTMTDNKSLTFANILDVREDNKVILIEGGPGMGKSTLAIKICKCWADDELLEEYDAVILLPLRDPEIQAANNIGDLLLVENRNEREVLYDEITASEGDKVCFIFEGYDELPEQLRKAPVFAKLKEKLPKCTVMYTSRPEACNQLRHTTSQRIEIRGFKEEQVDEYINNAFENVEDGKEKALKLTAQVKSNPSIRSVLYVPINVAIICHLFLLTLTLPNTLTELYTLLCINLILRYINKHSPGEVDFLDSLDELPTGASEQFSNLCLIAYRGREDNRIIFSSREVKGYGIDPSMLSDLGLLLIAPSTSVYGREKSYNFLHLTVQEYCAAFYISKLPDKEQHECFKKYQFYESFQMIWRMYSGITRLRNKDIFHHMLPSKWVKSEYRKRRITELLHCVYEAHNDEVCNVVGNHLDGDIDLSWRRLDQISCSALGYLLKEYRGALKVIQLDNCHIGDEGCMILLNSLLSRHDNSYSSKLEVILDSNKITDKSFSLIASLLSSNYPITKIDVSFNKLSSSTDIIFKSLHHNNVLTELLLWHTSLRPSDYIQSLGQMLTSNNTLSVMDISDNDIAAQYITEWRDVSLNKLIMSDCKLGVSGADKIGKMLCHNKSITSVHLGGNRIGDEGVEKLVEHLKSNKTIKYLGLWNNNITSNGANHLSKLFSLNHTTVNSIQLGGNPLKDEGVDLILQSITITMEYVGLHNTGMTSCSSVSTALHKIKSINFTLPDNCDGISDSLADSTVLEELKLNDGSDTANHTMISGINRNNSIKKLRFHKGQLHHQTLSDLVEVIKVNKIITELVIVDVDVSPSDRLLLADVLTVNTSIKEMTIHPSVERLNQSLVLQLLKQLKHNYTLEVLSLRVTREAYDDKQFIRDVEILVEDMNNIRHSHGVTTPLHVEL